MFYRTLREKALRPVTGLPKKLPATMDLRNRESSLHLRPWASLLLFISGYAPLMLILVIKDCSVTGSLLPQHPFSSVAILSLSLVSCLAVRTAVASVGDGLPVQVTKASNKSGDMFGYTIPYMISFVRVDLSDWQTLLSLAILLAMLFVIAYRTQAVFINPVLALAGYMLIDCTFKRGDRETQALVLTRSPLYPGDSCTLDQLSYYLYVATNLEAQR